MTITGLGAFSRLYLQSNPPEIRPHAQQQTGTARIGNKEQVYYTEDKYKSANQFERSPEFQDFKNQFDEGIAAIKEFTEKYIESVDKKNHINTCFQTLRKRIFDPGVNFFRNHRKDHRERVYGAGKQSFDTFVALLKNDDISRDTRISELTQLADGVIECNDGAATHLAVAARDLQLKAGGVYGEAWRMKERIVMNFILEFVHENHPETVSNEDNVHVRNMYNNYLSDTIGIPEQVDKSVEDNGDDVPLEMLEECRKLIEKKLSPSHLAMTMAGECISKVDEYIQKHLSGSLHWKVLSTEKWKGFIEVLEQSYGQLNLRSLLQPNDAETVFEATSNPTLAALDILTTLKKQNLLQKESQPQLVQKWMEKDTEFNSPRGFEIKLLRWGAGPILWIERGAEGAEMAEKEMLQLKHMKRIDLGKIANQEVESAIVRQLIANTPPDKLGEVRTGWLVDTECIMALFGKLTTRVGADNYLRDNEAWVKALPAQQKKEIAQRVMKENMDLFVPLLGKWELLEPDPDKSMLAEKIMNGNTKMVMAMAMAGAEINLKLDINFDGMARAAANVEDHEDMMEVEDLENMMDVEHPENVLDAEPEIVNPLENAQNDEQELRALLTKKVRMPPLVLASMYGNNNMVLTLLANRADIRGEDEKGRTALMYAAEYLRHDVVETLLKYGAKPNAVCHYGMTPLLSAISGNCDAEMVRLLLRKGADPTISQQKGEHALIEALYADNTAAVEVLLEQTYIANIPDENGKTPLMHAAELESFCLADLCLKTGIDFEASDNAGRGVLELAASQGKAGPVDTLLRHMPGRIVGRELNRALFAAAVAGQAAMVKKLLEKEEVKEKVDPAFVHTFARTAYTAAVAARQLESVKMFVQAGFDVNHQDGNQMTPLITAAQRGDVEIIEVLIEAGANVNLQGRDLQTALHWAAKEGHAEAYEALLKKGARQDIQDKVGNTPLAVLRETRRKMSASPQVGDKHDAEMQIDSGRRKSLKTEEGGINPEDINSDDGGLKDGA